MTFKWLCSAGENWRKKSIKVNVTIADFAVLRDEANILPTYFSVSMRAATYKKIHKTVIRFRFMLHSCELMNVCRPNGHQFAKLYHSA